MPRLKDEPQMALDDRIIEDEALEAAIARFLATKDGAKVHALARKKMNDRLNEIPDVEDGEKIRCGPYVMEGKRRGGGGFEIPHWEKVGIGRIARIGDQDD